MSTEECKAEYRFWQEQNEYSDDSYGAEWMWLTWEAAWKTRAPKPVSLARLHKTFTDGYMEESESNARDIEKCEKAGISAVLEAAGVKYVQ